MSICQISIWPPGTCLGIGIEPYGAWHTEANVAQEEYDRVLEEVRNTENWCHFNDFTEQQKGENHVLSLGKRKRGGHMVQKGRRV
jgi:hypothetical protein